jgi:GT2 family glycosyltransferase
MKDKILVIVPVLNLWERYTKPMLESLHCSVAPWAVYLIDNGSTDYTKEVSQLDIASSAASKVLIVKRNEENKGCGGGWNQGLEYGMAHGFTHFLIVNNDVLLSPLTIDRLYTRFKVGDKLLVSAVDVSGELPVPQQILDPNHPVSHKDASEAPHPSFSCFMVSRETVEKVGYFDEAFFPAYFEDNDFHYRIKLAAGDEAAIATTRAVYYHFGSRTQNEAIAAPIVKGDMFEANRRYFIRKWGGAPGSEQFTHPFNDVTQPFTYAERRS